MRRTLLAFGFLAACHSAPSTPATPKPVPDKFEDMDLDQRMKFMQDVVLPKTKAVFQKFDPVKYANFDCKTCHGDGANEGGNFEMPNPKIKVLPGTEETFVAWVSKDETAMKYTQMMAGELEPLMGQLLKVQVFDPKTKAGEFSCNACHLLDPPAPKKEHHHDHHDHH